MTLPERIHQSLLSVHPLWVSTPDLIAELVTGMTHPRSRVWAALRDMVGRGEVEKERRKAKTYWRVKK